MENELEDIENFIENLPDGDTLEFLDELIKLVKKHKHRLIEEETNHV